MPQMAASDVQAATQQTLCPAVMSLLHTRVAASRDTRSPCRPNSTLGIGSLVREHRGVLLLQFDEGIKRIRARLLGS